MDEETLFGLIFSGAFLVVIGVLCLFVIAVYVVQSISLYKMAVKMGYDKPWMAWIPYANIYLMFVLPDKPFKVLAINKEIEDRSNAFWIYLAITLGTSFVSGILLFIPIIGTILASILPIAVAIVTIFFQYPLYKDLYELFFDESQATTFSVLSIIIPITMIIFFIMASKKEPHAPKEIDGRFYS